MREATFSLSGGGVEAHTGSNLQFHGQKYKALAIHMLLTLNMYCWVRLALLYIADVSKTVDPIFKTTSYHIYISHLPSSFDKVVVSKTVDPIFKTTSYHIYISHLPSSFDKVVKM